MSANIVVSGVFEFDGKVVHQFQLPASDSAAAASSSSPMQRVVQSVDEARLESNRFLTQEMDKAKAAAKNLAGSSSSAAEPALESKQNAKKSRKQKGKGKGKGNAGEATDGEQSKGRGKGKGKKRAQPSEPEADSAAAHKVPRAAGQSDVKDKDTSMAS